jgi:hypothetical protein
VAHPQPGSSAPPYSTTAEYVSTGIASSVMSVFVVQNIGPTAPVGGRRRLAGYTDVAYGASVTGRGRWQPMLTLFQELADGGAVNGIPPGFRIVQLPAGLWFETYQPTDRTADVRFSLALGNLLGFEYRQTPPEANWVFMGGQGTGNARTVYEQSDGDSIAKWGRREAFVDAASAANTTELAQAATKALTDMGEKSSLAITPIDTSTVSYGVHYQLGDMVSAVVDEVGPGGDTQLGDTITDVVRACKIRLTPESTTVTPAVGTDGGSLKPVKFFDRLAAIESRMNDVERG